MFHRIELPNDLGSPFHIRDAERAGIGRTRRDAADLARPFPGIRSLAVPDTFREKLACYAPRMGCNQLVSGVSAARIWGLPVSWFWRDGESIEIAVPHAGAAPKVRGVHGRRVASWRIVPMAVDGFRVVDPVAAVFLIAPRLNETQAVVMIDALITDADNYPDLRGTVPLATLSSIRERLAEWGPFHGVRVIRAALERAREHVESPKETETRLAIVDAGLPEPEVQFVVRDRGVFVARGDLAYPQLKTLIEYEGDGHRTDRQQWRDDIRRRRTLENLGWKVLSLTADDLKRPDPGFISQLRRMLLLFTE